jgi:hypothetical protein
VALFVLILVGVVVAQTWFDWRDERKSWVVPEWAKGMALGGVIAVSLAATTSFASVWLREAADQSADGFVPRVFWPELAFLLCAMGVIVFATRRKRLRFMLLFGVVLVAALWFGVSR